MTAAASQQQCHGSDHDHETDLVILRASVDQHDGARRIADALVSGESRRIDPDTAPINPSGTAAIRTQRGARGRPKTGISVAAARAGAGRLASRQAYPAANAMHSRIVRATTELSTRSEP